MFPDMLWGLCCHQPQTITSAFIRKNIASLEEIMKWQKIYNQKQGKGIMMMRATEAMRIEL